MKLFKTLVLILSFTLIASCGESDNEDLPAFANPDAPEYRALKFFDAIYNKKDMTRAQKHATEKLARILRSYGSTRSYARYVLNLQLNEGVELKIDRSLNQVTTGKENVTTVNILFTGMLNDDRINDVRKVIFIKLDGDWLIDSIEDNPYMKR